MRPLVLPSLLAATAAGCAASDTTPKGAVRSRLWSAAVGGHLEVTRGGVPNSGTKLDLIDDLDLAADDQLELAAELEIGPIRAALAWMPLHFEGRERLDDTEVFHGTTYPAGNLVDTDLDLTTWRAALETPVFETDRMKVNAGLGAYWWTLDVNLTDQDARISDEREFSRLLPAIVGSGQWRIAPRLSAAAEAGFGTIGNGRRIFDVDMTARAAIARGGAFLFGFRWMRYDLNEDTNEGRINLLGPTFGLEWRW